MSLMEKEVDEKVKELQRQYYRNYRKNNPERIKAIKRRYWEKKALKALQEGGLDGKEENCQNAY